MISPSLFVHLGTQLAPAPLPACYPLRVECSCQVEKVAVHIVVGPLYKVLKNCLSNLRCVWCKMFQIWTFPSAPSTERVPSLAERVAYFRYSINLRISSWRVPALSWTLFPTLCLYGGQMQMKERLLPGNGQSLWWQITYTVYVSLTEYKGKLLAAVENYLVEGKRNIICPKRRENIDKYCYI